MSVIGGNHVQASSLFQSGIMLHCKPMEYEKASEILKDIIVKHPLTLEEKEALQTAMGLLTLGAISKNHLKSRLKAQAAKKNKEIKW